jgi:hypothetical protein
LKKVVQIGGLNKPEALQKLSDLKIQVNDYGWQLLKDSRFTISESKESIPIRIKTVSELGFKQGAKILEIMEQAKEEALDYCPLELALFFRFQYMDQEEKEEGFPLTKHKAPKGSLTVASRSLDEDQNFPKGFYLRKIHGVLWLRGYLSSDEHLWNPEDHFVFRKR